MNKKIICFLILYSLASISSHGQKYIDTLYSFKIEDSKLIWQKIYKSKTNAKKGFKLSVLSSVNKRNLIELDNVISFEVSEDKFDYRKYGGKWGNTPIYAQRPMRYLVVVEFKPNKYRVTLKSIEIIFPPNIGNSYLQDIVVKRKINKIKNNSTHKKPLQYYDLHFSSQFLVDKKKVGW